MDYEAVAREAAEKAGAIAMQHFGREILVETKRHESDLVTEADRKAEKAIIETISKAYPGHGILGEETGYREGSEDAVWYVDPIDGTQNFLNRIPLFCVSIGVAEKGKMVAAAVNVPALGQMFTASRGKGAFMNGRPIRVSSENSLRKGSVFFCQKINSQESIRKHVIENQKKISHKVGALRDFGSTAFHLAMIARGSFVAQIEHATHVWDEAAGNLLIEEAGGKVTDFEGNPRKPQSTSERSGSIASNGSVHEQILDLIKEN